MAVCLLGRRTTISRLPTFCFLVSRKQPLAGNICLFSTQASTKPAIFQRIPREELVPKVKSRLKDRPYMVGSTGGGFPEFLGEPTESFPHGVFVNNPHQASLSELTAKCMKYVEDNLTENPAILFRNLPVQTAQDFSIIAQAIPWKTMESKGAINYRSKVDKNAGTYTASDDPRHITIDPHNEFAYNDVYPSKIFFFCVQEPADGCGGETPLVKNSDVLSALDPDIVHKIELKQVRYVRYYPDKSNGEYMNWQFVYQTDDREVVQKQAKEQGTNLTWDPSGDLYTWQNRPACIHHPITGRKTWFNQIATHHGSYYRLLPGKAEIPDNKLPGNTCYGDGSVIEPEVVQHILASGWSCAVGFKWRKGDLLVLDNLTVQHARIGYKGDREIVVCMTA